MSILTTVGYFIIGVFTTLPATMTPLQAAKLDSFSTAVGGMLLIMLSFVGLYVWYSVKAHIEIDRKFDKDE